MATLASFPNELLHAIVRSLDSGDVAAVSATCHALRAAVKPVLYSDIRLVYPNDYGSKPASCDWRVAALLRTLVTDPETGGLVRRFEMSCPTVYRPSACRQLSQAKPPDVWSESELLQVKQALEGMCLSDRASWEDHLMRSDVTAVVAMIIWHCPGLRSFNVNWRYLFANGLALDMLAHAIPQGRFANLQSLVSPFPYRWKRVPHQHPLQFLAFFYLPRLKTLDFALPHPTREDRAALRAQPDMTQHWPLVAMPPPAALHLTRLLLGLRDTLHEVVPLVLSWTPNLKHLYLHYELDDATPPLDMEQLRHGLERVAGTLETLVIRLQLFITQDNVDPLKGTLGSLRSLHSLQTLDVSLGTFFDRSPDIPEGQHHLTLADTLPPNLEYLAINDDIAPCYERYLPLWNWGAAMALMRFLAGARLAGAWRPGPRADSPLAYRAFDAASTAADYGQGSGRWMRADWRAQDEPGWRRATPRLRALEVVRNVSRYLEHGASCRRPLTDDLADACAAQGLAFYHFDSPSRRGQWLVDRGHAGWPFSTFRALIESDEAKQEISQDQ